MTTFLTCEGKGITKAVYRIRNNLQQFIKLGLPEGSVVWSSFVSDQPVKPAEDEAGKILIPLEKSTGGTDTLASFPLESVYITDMPRLGRVGRVRVPLPAVDLPLNQIIGMCICSPFTIILEWAGIWIGGSLTPFPRYPPWSPRRGLSRERRSER